MPVLRARRAMDSYFLYHLNIRSAFPLQSPGQKPGAADLHIRKGSPFFFKQLRRSLTPRFYPQDRLVYQHLKDGSEYACYFDAAEFWISSDGKEIRYAEKAPDGNRLPQNFLSQYLQTSALSFSLIKRGLEPLHGTAVRIGDGAAAFIGDSGTGKSTLAAEFLQQGYPVLTDDLLILRKFESAFRVLPGTSHLKLFPAMSQRLGWCGRASRLNPLSRKYVFPVRRTAAAERPVPLKVLYILLHPKYGPRVRRIRIEPVPARQAILEMTNANYNLAVDHPQRRRQQFQFASELALNIPVRSLRYPRNIRSLTAVREAILKDLQRLEAE